MKKLFNLMVMVLAVCGISCSNLGDENITPGSGGNDNIDNGGDTNVTTTFAIKVSDITPLGAYVSVAPSDNTTTYYFDVVSKDKFENFADTKSFAKKVVADLKEYCKSQGGTFAELLFKGANEFQYSSYFTPNTEYYAFAFGVTADGTLTTAVATKPFTTLEEVVDASMTFEVAVSDITSNSACVSVIPSTNVATYYFDVVSKEKMEEYSDAKEYAEWLIRVIKEPYDFYGKPFAEILSVGTTNKYQFEEGTFAPDTEYYAIAFGVTTAGVVTTEVTSVPFKTKTAND